MEEIFLANFFFSSFADYWAAPHAEGPKDYIKCFIYKQFVDLAVGESPQNCWFWLVVAATTSITA